MTNRQLIFTLAMAALFGFAGMLALSTVLPDVAADLNTTVAVAAQINTVTLIIGALLGLVVGPAADHYGLRRTIVAAAVLLAISSFATAASTEYWMLLLSRIPAGLAVLAAVSVAIASVRLPEAERRNGVSWVVAGPPAAGIIAIPILATIAHHAHWRISFVVFGTAVLFVTVMLWRVVPEDPPVPQSRLDTLQVLRAYRPILGHPATMFYFLADVLRGITWFAFVVFVASFFVERLGLTLQAFGLFMIAAGTCYLAGTRLSGLGFEKMGLGTVFYLSTAVMAITGALAMTIGTSPAPVMALFLVFALMGGIGFPAITLLITETSPAGKGTTMMLRAAGLGMAQALGAGLGGVLLTLGGYPALGFGLAGFALLAAAAVTLGNRASLPVQEEAAVG